MKGCNRARGAILAAGERALSIEDRFALERHLELCATCSELHARTQAIDEALEKLGAAEVPDLSDPSVERAVAGVRRALEDLEPRAPRRSVVRRAAVLAAAIAVVLVAWLVARSLPAGAERSGPDALSGKDPSPATPPEVEALVRAELRATFGALEPAEDVRAASLAFEERTLALRRAGWPLRRYVEDLLDDPDLAVAAAAARALGALGDPLSAARLERALACAELAPEALRALEALGAAAVPPLERALDQPALAVAALRGLSAIGGPDAAAAIERRLLDSGAGAASIPSRQALLDALSMSGPAAVASLLRVARAADEPGDVLTHLAFVAGADAELVRLLGRPDAGWSSAIVLEALGILQPEGGLAWLEERCGETRERPGALDALERWRGPAPIASLLRLEASGRVPREELLGLLRELLARDERRFVEFTRTLLGGKDAPVAQRLSSLLVESEHAGAGAPLALLALDEALPDDARQWAALALGEFARAADAELLASGLGQLGDEDRRLFAACVISIHDRLGEAGVEAALADFTPRELERVFSALADLGDRGAVGLHRVARALDPALTRRSSGTWNQTL